MSILFQRSVSGVLFLLWLVCAIRGEGYGDYQDYQDYADGYQQDNLYADYANQKAAGGGGWGKTVVFGAVTWFLGGRVHSKRAVKKLTKKHQEDQKKLVSQYYKDVLALQNQNAELAQIAQDATKHQLDSEFEAADVDNDNRVSRAEFNMHKNAYLKKHPEMASQFPKFEDFDPDSDGMISKAEYDAYYRNLQYIS